MALSNHGCLYWDLLRPFTKSTRCIQCPNQLSIANNLFATLIWTIVHSLWSWFQLWRILNLTCANKQEGEKYPKMRGENQNKKFRKRCKKIWTKYISIILPKSPKKLERDSNLNKYISIILPSAKPTNDGAAIPRPSIAVRDSVIAVRADGAGATRRRCPPVSRRAGPCTSHTGFWGQPWGVGALND